MQKADRALESASMLLAAGDTDGACNRAYYAMFDAARAALSSVEDTSEGVRTHRGLISAFGLLLVNPGRLSRDFGRMLSSIEPKKCACSPTIPVDP
jgi:uncharacterized protein (UPF0332 family)